ncbi:MAG: STAS domain-containing protein [Chloroflexi bacterium]|nr:STAS domain-containing protein [Chloroflexota bacterium]
MEIKERTIESTIVFSLSGRLDAASAPQLAKGIEKYLSVTPLNLAIEMKDITFIDSTGLSILVQGLKRCRERQGNLAIFGIQQTVRIIFELTRLDKAFDIYINEAEALNGITHKSK